MNNAEPHLDFDCRFHYASGFELQARICMTRPVAALVGPSGSGKTTILSLVSGLLQPSAGYITVGRERLADTASRSHVPPERRKIGLVFQDNCLFPHMTVQANLQYGLRGRNGSANSSPQISLANIIDVLELNEVLGRYPNSLSGGQKQRVALGRAIASQPSLLLLDEPLTSVEERLRVRISDFVEKAIREFQLPTLLVSHNEQLVGKLAKQVFYLEDGKVVGETADEGTP